MFLQAKGKYAKQAHVNLPEGLFEEEHGRDGFYGPVSHLYRKHAPTGWTRIEGPLRPHAFDCNKLAAAQPLSAIQDRVTVLHNEDVSVQISRPKSAHDFYFRNADGDELYFIHAGSGEVETDFGSLTYEKGDYIHIPRGTTYRFVPKDPHNFFLIFESAKRIRQPERGLLGHNALYDQTVLETPEPKAYADAGKTEWEIKIKRLNQLTSVFYPFNPLDVEGWKGDLFVSKLNVRDIRPIMSHRVHLPPSAHSTFLADGWVVVSFLPRPLESEEGAMRVPFYHRNIDYDEVIFYHEGEFFSRDGIGPGMITFHPQGIHHGPHPNAIESSWSKSETQEIAIMIDTERPLTMTSEATSAEWTAYWESWKDTGHKQKAQV